MNKKKLYILIGIALLIALSGIFLMQMRGHGYFSAIKNYISYSINKPDFTKLEPLRDEENGWYKNNALVAHAMGGIEGIDYTNTKEAFDKSYSNGYKIFEVDLSVTSDRQVVCTHDFDEFGQNVIPAYDDFMDTKVGGRYTAIDLQDIVNYLIKYDDIYVMTDFKWDNSFGSNNQDVLTIMDTLKEKIGKRQDLYDRIIIQVYSKENYKLVRENYPFKNYVFTLYQYAYPIYEDIAAFCIENNILVVTMGKERATRENIEIFREWNIHVFSHTVNDFKEAKQQFENGVSGIYTDWITPQSITMERK